MPAQQSSSSSSSTSSMHVVDMRSDFLTLPTESVRRVMYEATSNDDISREDPTVIELETKMAAMWGKEAALFLPSGTMANLLGMACHCPSRGLEIIMGDKSHTFLCEQGGISQFFGLHTRSVPNLDDGTFDLTILERSIRPIDDPHEPRTGLINVETTHNFCGGKAVPLSFFAAVREIADRHHLPIHMDGARGLSAAVALDVEPSVLAKDVDSISFCFSKGVGAPVGSVLIGTRDLIGHALRLRKALGAGWRKPGCLAAAALEAMHDAPERLREDHRRAKLFAERVSSFGCSAIRVDVVGVHTNIVMVEIIAKGLSAQDFSKRMREVQEYQENAGSDCDGSTIMVKAYPMGSSAAGGKQIVRFVVYSSLSEEDVMLAAKKVEYVLKQYTVANINGGDTSNAALVKNGAMFLENEFVSKMKVAAAPAN